jgi:hypothetical protein
MLNKFRERLELKLPEPPSGQFEHVFLYSAYAAKAKSTAQLLNAVEQNIKDEKESLLGILRKLGIYFGFLIVYNVVIRLVFRFCGDAVGILLCVIPLLWILYNCRHDFFTPQAIQVGAKGIRFFWVHTLWKYTSPWISWDSIEYSAAEDYNRKGKLHDYKSISVNLFLSKEAEHKIGKAFRWIIPKIVGRRSKSTDQLELQIDRNAFVREQDLNLLVAALRYHLGENKLDETLEQLRLPGEDYSYTSLWLEEFNSRLSSDLEHADESGNIVHSRYEIVKPIGSGGLSRTLLARVKDSADSEREVVLKKITLPTGGGKEILRRALENVRKEADLLKSLEHPQIVKCEDIFIEGKNVFICLQYVAGKTLRELIAENGPLEESVATDLGLQIIGILEYLHEQEPPIIHRDLTPDNLIVDADGRVTLIDFNVAQQNEGIETHSVVGKRNYIPPEQFCGKWSVKSDIYSFGCCMHWLLTGEDPEPISCSHPKAVKAELSEHIDRVVATATALDTNSRFSSAAAVRDELSRVGDLNPLGL